MWFNLILFDTGRNAEEYSVVKIENGKYIGFGYMNTAEAITRPEQLDNYIVKYSDNHEIQAIIRNYLRKQKVIKRVEY